MPSRQHYSGANRIPSIRQFLDSLDRDKKQRDADIEAELAARPKRHGRSEIVEHTAHAQPGKNRRVVTDPVTGRDVEIDDMDAATLAAAQNPLLSVPNANLGKDTPVKTEASQSGETYRYNQDVTAPPDPVAPGSTSDVPIHGEKTNVLFHPTPSVSYEPMFAAIEMRAHVLCFAVATAVVVVGQMCGGRLLGLVPLAAGVASAVFLWAKDVVRRGRDLEWSSEQARGETAVVNLIPESVEWLNAALALVWGLINPDMFAAVADTLEDVMQASVPALVENVKVNDIAQGTNPLRVLSLRALPDSHAADLQEGARRHAEDVAHKDADERAADEIGGSFYNLEATVAYHAAPPGRDSGAATAAQARRNMGMQLIFYLGVRGLFGVPLPIWVELNGLVATLRLRVALAPAPPFVKTVTATLMGLPRVEAGCIPLVERGANILNLPVIASFVNWAIAAAAGMYVAPRSLTLDVGQMLAGDSVMKDTNALGVLFVRIHKATGLSKQDARGSVGGGSDPYICVAFSKFGKPQYCTRVIQDDLNPVFEESAALLVTPEVLQADERLSLELWDSDRSSADDLVGKVELSIHQLMRHPGRMTPLVSRLAGLSADSQMPGELHWEVGFFGKPVLDSSGDGDPTKDGSRDQENAVLCTPPSPLWPSGILAVVVHQIVGLELENVQGSEGGRRKGKAYEPARPEAGDLKEEQGTALPSAYCTILVNDELVYKTRTKVVSSRPIFEAGTERFVRDWRAAVATVTVRDARHRQHDPILGVVPLPLADILRHASQSTRWYPLDGGIGFGRIRISVLFRSVELRLPPAQLGFGEVGTFLFVSDTLTTVGFAPSSRVSVRMRTGGSAATLKSSRCARHGDGLRWTLADDDNDDDDNNNQKIRLPVRHRYRSPVFFAFRVAGQRRASAYAALWLQDLVDGEPTDVDLPVWACDNPLRLSQNYVTEKNAAEVPDLALRELGRLRFRARFKPGTDRSHRRFVSDNDARETLETWEACFAEGVREEEVVAGPAVQPKNEGVLGRGAATNKERATGEAGETTTGTGETTTGTGETNRQKRVSIVTPSDITGEATDVTGDATEVTNTDGSGPSRLSASTRSSSASASSRPTAESSRSSQASSPLHSSPSQASHRSNPVQQYKEYRAQRRDLHRRHRGLMQWKPMRNIQFAKDEATFAVRRVMKVGKLQGREPDIETEVP